MAKRLELEVKKRGRSLKDVVNQALRIGLGLTDKPVRPKRFIVQPHALGFRPGIDVDRLNQLVDELSVEENARKLK